MADEQFFIWAIDDVTEALPLLTQLQWDGEGQTLRQTIQERIAQAMQQETRHRFSMAATLVRRIRFELIGLVQLTRVSYPRPELKIRLTENMVDKRESYTKEDLLASGRGELFGAKGPQLPAPSMLMMDRVVKMTETGGNYDKGYVEAELDINPDLWFFGCHFIGDPVMPGCLGLDAM